MMEDQAFRNIPSLRWHRAEDGLTVATCRPQRIAKDELYFHGPGKLGIHWFADTPRSATARRIWWKSKLRRVLEEFPGDLEGIIIFEARDGSEIPREFFRQEVSGVPFKKTR